MKIFLIWMGLICCSVANGLLFDAGEKAGLVRILMVFPCVLVVYLLYLHRKITKDWTKSPNDPWSEDRFPVFSLTFFLSMVITVMLWFSSENSHTVLIGSITSTIASAIAFWREKDYTHELYDGG